MDRKTFFQLIMDICDWDSAGDDEKVLAPLIDYLSQQPDDEIFAFHETMADLLYELDTRKNFKKARKYYDHSDDSFLYARCCALINGEEYYEKVKSGKNSNPWTMEFEAILYVPMLAWSKKHHKRYDEYPHHTAKSFETGSNADQWK